MLSRRGFLGSLSALVGGVLLEQAIPFNRVWSFPKNIVIAKPEPDLTAADLDLINQFTQKYITPTLSDSVFSSSPLLLRLSQTNLTREQSLTWRDSNYAPNDSR